MSLRKIIQTRNDEFLAWIVDEYPDMFGAIEFGDIAPAIKSDCWRFIEKLVDIVPDIDGWARLSVAPLNFNKFVAVLTICECDDATTEHEFSIELRPGQEKLLLLRRFACVRIDSLNFHLAFLRACHFDKLEIVEFLLDKSLIEHIELPGADTLLMLALSCSGVIREIIDVVMDRCGDYINFVNTRGKSAFSMAQEKNMDDIALAIVKHPCFDPDAPTPKVKSPKAIAFHHASMEAARRLTRDV